MCNKLPQSGGIISCQSTIYFFLKQRRNTGCQDSKKVDFLARQATCKAYLPYGQGSTYSSSNKTIHLLDEQEVAPGSKM